MITDATTHGLRVLAADEDEEALERLAAMLGELGHTTCAFAVEVSQVAHEVATEDPDISIVVLHQDDDHALALIDEICAYASGPVIALTQAEDPDFVARAAERGIAAYGKPSSASAVQSAMELALHRHAEIEQLTERVDQLEGALERRAIIERAKGMLMERHEIDERVAFERLRTHAPLAGGSSPLPTTSRRARSSCRRGAIFRRSRAAHERPSMRRPIGGRASPEADQPQPVLLPQLEQV